MIFSYTDRSSTDSRGFRFFLTGAGAILFTVLGVQYLHEHELRRRLPPRWKEDPMRKFVQEFFIDQMKCTPARLAETGKSMKEHWQRSGLSVYSCGLKISEFKKYLGIRIPSPFPNECGLAGNCAGAKTFTGDFCFEDECRKNIQLCTECKKPTYFTVSKFLERGMYSTCKNHVEHIGKERVHMPGRGARIFPEFLNTLAEAMCFCYLCEENKDRLTKVLLEDENTMTHDFPVIATLIAEFVPCEVCQGTGTPV